MIAMMLEEFVDTLGHHVHAITATVSDGCDLARSGGFDLAILDCHLAGEYVWPLAEILDKKDIPFIFSSGGSISEMPPEFADRPMLSKPYTIGDISDMLEAAIA